MPKHNRSNSYQHLFAEINVEQVDLERFEDNSPSIQDDYLKDLNDDAMRVLLSIAYQTLTWRQYSVIMCVLAGKTQWDIADIYGVHQSTIHKIINGNTIYDKTKSKKYYGGVEKKLSKSLLKSKTYKNIIRAIKLFEETGIKTIY